MQVDCVVFARYQISYQQLINSAHAVYSAAISPAIFVAKEAYMVNWMLSSLMTRFTLALSESTPLQ